MNIALDQLDDTIPDLRRVAPSPQADAAMLATIAARGVLQPILVRPADNRFEIVLGRRRVRLARFDTEVFLGTLPSEELRMLARQADMSVPKLVRDLRKALVGKLPAWRPTTFGAPGPRHEAPSRSRREEALAE